MTISTLDDRQRRDWLRLSRTEGVGPRTFFALLSRFGGAGAALEALPAIARVKGRSIRIPSQGEIDGELARAMGIGASIIAFNEAEYPALLREIDAPPPLIGVLGQLSTLACPMVAIVGARNSSAPGRKMASRLAAGLAEAGYVVVSGLARGIDTEAHRASLAGGTVAVLAGGLDKPYPPENVALLEEICRAGAVVSEMPMGWVPRGQDFPRRNRIISGLSQGVIIVEAARRSGSLITARMANEQGREVFAVPGSPLDPRCEGTNDLLREGASLVTSVEDILTILTPLAGKAGRSPRLFTERARIMASSDEDWEEPDFLALPEHDGATPPIPDTVDDAVSSLRDLLSLTPVEIDSLARMAGIEARALSSILVEMELNGEIVRLGGNRVALAVTD